jgi:hypothetical protein
MANDQQILNQLRRQITDLDQPAVRFDLDAVMTGGRRRARRATLGKAIGGIGALAVAALGSLWWTADEVRTAPDPADGGLIDAAPLPDLSGMLEATGDNDAMARELAGVFEQALASVGVTSPGEVRTRWLILTPSGRIDESGEPVGWRMSWSSQEYPGWLVSAELQLSEHDLPTEVWEDRIGCEQPLATGRNCTEETLTDGRVTIWGETNAYSPPVWAPEVAILRTNSWHLTIRVIPLADELPADLEDYTGPATLNQLRELGLLELWDQVPMPESQAG